MSSLRAEGAAEGDSVGLLVGDGVVGVIVGFAVGLGVVGYAVGDVVGDRDGDADAVTVGFDEGLLLGEEVGAPHSIPHEHGQYEIRSTISWRLNPMAPSTAQSKVTCPEQGSWSFDLKFGSSRQDSSQSSGQVVVELIGKRPRSDRDLWTLIRTSLLIVCWILLSSLLLVDGASEAQPSTAQLEGHCRSRSAISSLEYPTVPNSWQSRPLC